MNGQGPGENQGLVKNKGLLGVTGFIKKRKRIFVSAIIILILVAGGFFYWWEFYETPPDKWHEAEYSPPEDYEIIETGDGVFVENKKAGLSFKVPDGWRVERERYGTSLVMYSQEAEEEKSFLMKKGCKIYGEVTYIKISLQVIEQGLRKRHETWGYIDEYEIVEVDHRDALKNTTGIISLSQQGVGIHIPVKGLFESKLYYLSLSSNIQDRKKCIQEFEEFLKTVSIY